MKEKMLFCCQGEQCSESCCGAFSEFSDRLFSVEGREFKDIILTPQDFNRLHESIYNKYIFIDKDGIKKIKTDEQGVCSAYQSGKCLMNDFKPTICKCFPLYLDAFIGLCAFKDCPSVKKIIQLKIIRMNYSIYLICMSFGFHIIETLLISTEEEYRIILYLSTQLISKWSCKE